MPKFCDVKYFALSLGLLMTALVLHSPSSLFTWALNATVGPETVEEDLKNLAEWSAPHEYLEQFPYELAGKDKDGSPVWALQLGKWNIKAMVEKEGGEEEMKKYTLQMFKRFHDVPASFPNATDYVILVDLEGFSSYHSMNPTALRVLLSMTRQYTYLEQNQRIKHVYDINTNDFFRTVYSLATPILGNLTDVVTLYGTDKAEWTRELLKKIPQDQLPAFAGGFANHEPIEFYGVKSSKAVANETPEASDAAETTTDRILY